MARVRRLREWNTIQPDDWAAIGELLAEVERLREMLGDAARVLEWWRNGAEWGDGCEEALKACKEVDDAE
jgi:hypothetical protein